MLYVYSLCVLLSFYNVSSDARSCVKNAGYLCSQTKTQIRHNLSISSHMIGVTLVVLSSVFKPSRDEQLDPILDLAELDPAWAALIEWDSMYRVHYSTISLYVEIKPPVFELSLRFVLTMREYSVCIEEKLLEPRNSFF